MTLKRTFTIAVAAASIFGGALVAIPLLASAQDDASLFESETNKEESNNQEKRKDKDHGPKRGAFIGEILLEVGLDADIVKEGFANGQTLGETAEANGISSETIVDAIVTAMTERLNQAVQARNNPHAWETDEGIATARGRARIQAGIGI